MESAFLSALKGKERERMTIPISASLLRTVENWKPATVDFRVFPDKRQERPKKAAKPAPERLSSTARLLLVHIKRLARKGSLETTKASLGGWLNRCRRAVRYALAELESFGLIRTQALKGPLGLYAGLLIEVECDNALFNPADFYARAEKARNHRGAIPCTASADSFLLTLQRQALKKIRAEKSAKARLDQYRLQIE